MSAFSQTKEKIKRYGIETDILWPFFPGATRTHFTIKLWEKGHFRGDIYVGINVDFPKNRETELGVLQNHVTTGQTYYGFDWLISGYVGYKVEFFRKKLYVIPQFGVAGVIYKSNPWPIYEDNTLTKEIGEAPFLLGSLRFGYNF
jgi:hypothetical protein